MAKIVILTSDLRDAASLRRIRSLQSAGHEIVSISSRKGALPEISWDNVDLGEIGQRRLASRAALALRAALFDKRLRQAVRGADLLIARNLDMLALARVLRISARPGARLAYEVLDIHPIFESGRTAPLARMVERRLMAKIDLLLVSSPGFLRGYFEPVQRYHGPSHLLENKLVLSPALPRPQLRPPRLKGAPLRLGWVGAIRCDPSLDLLLAVAKARPEQIELHIHGTIHHHALTNFDTQIAELANVIYFGPYSYPDGLATAYASCDAVWAQDLWQRGKNSDLLLPNRLYEAGWHLCPAIALEETETGRRIMKNRQGWTIGSATPEALLTLLDKLPPERIQTAKQEILDLPEALFRQSLSDLEAMLRAAGLYPHNRPDPQSPVPITP